MMIPTHKHISTSLTIILLVSISLLSGCVENPNDEGNDPSDPPGLEDYILKTSDLPEGYVITTIDRNLSQQIGFTSEIPTEEVLGITFAYDSETNLSGWPFIAVTVGSYISFKNAKDAISFSEFVMSRTISNLFNDSGQPFTTSKADSSLGKYYNGTLNESYDFAHATWTYLFARVNKTNFFVSIHKIDPDETFQYQEKTIELMNIMIERFTSLN